MSLRGEQYHALLRSRDLLRKLLDPRTDKRMSTLRMEAAAALRHFPLLDESTGRPIFSVDPFGPDEPPQAA